MQRRMDNSMKIPDIIMNKILAFNQVEHLGQIQ